MGGLTFYLRICSLGILKFYASPEGIVFKEKVLEPILGGTFFK